MTDRVLVFYGSYRSDRMGIRLADYIVAGLKARGEDVELIDAKAIGLPMLDRMFKEYAPRTAPQALEVLASKIRAADAFVFVTGEYNWGMQPGLKNLTDHFLEEWFWRPAAIASYSAGRICEVAHPLWQIHHDRLQHHRKQRARRAHRRPHPAGQSTTGSVEDAVYGRSLRWLLDRRCRGGVLCLGLSGLPRRGLQPGLCRTATVRPARLEPRLFRLEDV